MYPSGTQLSAVSIQLQAQFPEPPQMFVIAATGRLTADSRPLIAKPQKALSFQPSAFSFRLSFPEPPQMFAIAATGRLTADNWPLIAKPQNLRVPRRSLRFSNTGKSAGAAGRVSSAHTSPKAGNSARIGGRALAGAGLEPRWWHGL
jgi:hypothetical protein